MNTIEFDHFDKKIKALVIYDPKKANDVITLILLNHTSELGETIILTKSEEEWHRKCFLKKNFPETEKNLLYSLNEFLNKDLLLDYSFMLHDFCS
jgi:hypothetical protein